MGSLTLLIFSVFIVSLFLTVVYINRRGFSRRTIALPIIFILFTFAMMKLIEGGSVDIKRNVILVASCSDSIDWVHEAAERILERGEKARVQAFLFDGSGSNSAAVAACDQSYRKNERFPVYNVVDLAEFDASTTNEPFINLMMAALELGSFQRRDLWESLTHLFSRTTVVLLYNVNNTDWNTNVVSWSRDNIPMKIAGIMSDSDLFLLESEVATPAVNFQVDLSGDFQAGKVLSNIGALLDLSIIDSAKVIEDDVDIQLCLSFDGGVNWAQCRAGALKTRVGDVPALFFDSLKMRRETKGDNNRITWSLGEKNNAKDSSQVVDKPLLRELIGVSKDGHDFKNTLLTPGWHAIQFQARIVSGELEGMDLGRRVVHFKVEQRLPMVIFDQRTLYDAAWQENLSPNSYVSMFRDLWTGDRNNTKTQKSVLFRSLGQPRVDCIINVPLPNKDILENCAKESDSLILIEPTAKTLNELTNNGIVGRFLQKGGSILVGGAPTLDPILNKSVIDWLPAWPSKDKKDEITHFSRSLAVIGDCGLVAHQPVEGGAKAALNKNSRRLVDIEQQFVNALSTKLINAGSQSFPLDAGQGLIRVEPNLPMQPSFTYNPRMGCIRPHVAKFPGVADLLTATNPEYRIGAFLRDKLSSDVKPFLAFDSKALYPGSMILIMSTSYVGNKDMVNPNIKNRAGNGRNNADVNRIPNTDERLIDQLKKQGVGIISLEIVGAQKFLNVKDLQVHGEKIELWADRHSIPHFTVNQSTNLDNLSEEILKRVDAHAKAATLNAQILEYGRVMDPRMNRTPIGMPHSFQTLDKMDKSQVRHKLVVKGKDIPLIVEGRRGKGRVIVLAYNPFVPDVWELDHVKAALLKNQYKAYLPAGSPILKAMIFRASGLSRTVQKHQGLGALRLVDALYLSSAELPNSGQIRLREVHITPDGQTALFSIQLPADVERFTSPSLVFPSGNASQFCKSADSTGKLCPLQLYEINLAERKAKFLFTTSAVGGLPNGRYGLSSTGDTFFPIWLDQRRIVSGQPKERLAALLNLTGGHVLNESLGVAEADVSKVVGLTILAIVMLLFSPFVSSWAAVRRWRMRVRARYEEVRLSFDPDLLLQRVSTILAKYEATRRAGVPAWLRRFSAGDNLSQAVKADLVPFLDLGAVLEMPIQPPRVRLKETGLGFELLFIIDDALSLRHPGDTSGRSAKQLLLVSLLDVLAKAAAEHDGRWMVKGLRNNDMIQSSKGSAKNIVLEALTGWIEKGAVQEMSLELPSSALLAEMIVFSDFMSLSVEQVNELGRGREFSVILLYDPKQCFETGICVDSQSGRIFDRSDWGEADYESFSHAFYKNACEELEASQIRFALISTADSDTDIAEKLSASGILERSFAG